MRRPANSRGASGAGPLWRATRTLTGIETLDVLFVCTGNVCRSPMAEAFLRARLAQRGVPGTVRSAGTAAPGGPASAHGVDVLGERGLDLSAHRSTRLDADTLASADLVLGLAREHVREAVVFEPAAFGRTFTLKEVVRRGRVVGARAAGEPFDTWLARLHTGRTPRELLGESRDDDVEDPIGGDRVDYVRTADEIDALIAALVDLAFPRGSGPAPDPAESR